MTHDLTVVMLSGKAKVVMAGQTYLMSPGDIMEIPQVTLHWAENLHSGGSEVYAIFTPSYDGKDFVESSGR